MESRLHPRARCGTLPVVLALSVVVLVSGCVEAGPSVATSLSGWVNANAITLDPGDWSPMDGTDVLDSQLDAVEFVYLGEPDHYIQEKYDYRLGLIRYLVDRGFTYIGMEMGYSDGLRIDRYLESGDAAILEEVALYGHRDEYVAGLPDVMAAELARPYLDAFVDEERAFLAELLQVSSSLPGDERLHWFGFDIDIVPGGGYVDAERLLEAASADGGGLVEDVQQQLAFTRDMEPAQRVQALASLAAVLGTHQEELDELLGAAGASELSQTVQNLADSYRFQADAFAEPFGSTWGDAMVRREQDMIRRLDDGWLPALPDGAKAVLLGHNLHLSRSVESLLTGALDDPASSPMWQSIGAALAERRSVYAIWMLYDHGTTHTAFSSQPVTPVISDPARIESALRESGDLYLLPLADAHPSLDQPVNFNQNGAAASGSLTRLADALVFVDEVHAIAER